MSRFYELIAIYDREVESIEAAREVARQAEQERERAQALAETQRLYDIGPGLLGKLWAELTPAEPGPWGNTVPLRWVPGYTYLELRLGWMNGSAGTPDAGKKTETPYLRLNAGRHGNSHWTLWLPAPIERIAEFCARAASYRAQERNNDLYELKSRFWDIEDYSDEALAERAADEIKAWPDAVAEINAWLSDELVKRQAFREQKAARQAARQTAAPASVETQPPAPTDAERALALVRELLDLVHESQE